MSCELLQELQSRTSRERFLASFFKNCSHELQERDFLRTSSRTTVTNFKKEMSCELLQELQSRTSRKRFLANSTYKLHLQTPLTNSTHKLHSRTLFTPHSRTFSRKTSLHFSLMTSLCEQALPILLTHKRALHFSFTIYFAPKKEPSGRT